MEKEKATTPKAKIEKKASWDLSEKEWKSLSYNEKLDITDKVYDDDLIRNLKNSIEQIQNSVDWAHKSVVDAYQKDLSQEIKDERYNKEKLHEKALKEAEKQLEKKSFLKSIKNG